MATAVPSSDESVFDAMTEEITAVFDRILREVISRRDQLLSEVGKKRQDFKFKNSAMMDNLGELEEMRTQLEKMSVKQNLALKKQQESLAEIDSEIDKLKREVYNCIQLKYSCSPDQLIQQIKQFGEVIDEASNLTLAKSKYCQKLTAVKILKDYQGRVFTPEIRLHLDSNKELLYLSKSDREDILIYNANNLSSVRHFGLEEHHPMCLATGTEFVYVCYPSRFLFQFQLSDYELFKSIKLPFIDYGFTFNLAVSSDNQVFVLYCNGHLLIYDRILNLKEEVCLKFEKSGKGVCCQEVKLIEDIFYITCYQRILTVAVGDWNNVRYLLKTENGNCRFKSSRTLLFEQLVKTTIRSLNLPT